MRKDLNTSKKRVILFLLNLIILLLTYGRGIWNEHFSMDDFVCLYSQYEEASAVIFISYRVVLGILYLILDKLGINVVQYQILFGTIFLLLLSFASTELTFHMCNKTGKYKQDIKQLLLINVGCLILFINAFIAEWIWFALGYLQWGISTSFAIFAAIQWDKKRNILGLIETSILLFISSGCYQIAISFYVYLALLLIIISEKQLSFSTFVKQILNAAIPAIVGVLANILITKIIGLFSIENETSRINLSFTGIISNVKVMISAELNLLITARGALPQYILLVFFCFFGFMLIFNKGKKLEYKLRILINIAAGWFMMCLPLLLQSSFSQPPRTIVPIMGAIAVLFWGILGIHGNECSKKQKIILILGSLAVMSINYFSVQTSISDCILTTKLQQEEIESFYTAIELEEDKSKETVDNIVFINDSSPTWKYYDKIKNKDYDGEMATRSMVVDWANLQAFNYFSGRTFSKGTDISDTAYSYFAVFEECDNLDLNRQLFIEGDTAYILVY